MTIESFGLPTPTTWPAMPEKANPKQLTYSQAHDLLMKFAIALQDRQCCGDEFQPQYVAALKACTDAMGVDAPNVHELIAALRGIASCATQCPCCEMHQCIASEALRLNNAKINTG